MRSQIALTSAYHNRRVICLQTMVGIESRQLLIWMLIWIWIGWTHLYAIHHIGIGWYRLGCFNVHIVVWFVLWGTRRLHMTLQGSEVCEWGIHRVHADSDLYQCFRMQETGCKLLQCWCIHLCAHFFHDELVCHVGIWVCPNVLGNWMEYQWISECFDCWVDSLLIFRCHQCPEPV